ncbi:hypothetical protein D3C72_1188270 [compost metagenome]
MRCARTPSVTCVVRSTAATASRPRSPATRTGWKAAATGCRPTWCRRAMMARAGRSRSTWGAAPSTVAARWASSTSSIPTAAPRRCVPAACRGPASAPSTTPTATPPACRACSPTATRITTTTAPVPPPTWSGSRPWAAWTTPCAAACGWNSTTAACAATGTACSTWAPISASTTSRTGCSSKTATRPASRCTTWKTWRAWARSARAWASSSSSWTRSATG